MASPIDIRFADLHNLLKTQLVQFCKDNGHFSYGLKSVLIEHLLAYRANLPLPPTPTTSSVLTSSTPAIAMAPTNALSVSLAAHTTLVAPITATLVFVFETVPIFAAIITIMPVTATATIPEPRLMP